MTRREDVYENSPGCRTPQATAVAALFDLLQMTDLPSAWWSIADTSFSAGHIRGTIGRAEIDSADERESCELEALNVWALAFDVQVQTRVYIERAMVQHSIEFLYGESVPVKIYTERRMTEADR